MKGSEHMARSLRKKVHQVKVAYFKYIGEVPSKDNLLKKGDIFRLRQIIRDEDFMYHWMLEVAYDGCFRQFLQDGIWQKGDNETGGKSNFDTGLEFIKTEYPDAIEVKDYNTNFSFFGTPEQIEKIQQRIEDIIKAEFKDVDMFQDFNWDYIG
jgi:hypothetical protein